MYLYKIEYCKLLVCAAALCAAAFAPSCRHKVQADSPLEIRIYSVGDSPGHSSGYVTGVRGFGYALYQGARKLIDQPNIPCVPGKLPFRTREEAEMTARLVDRKLQAGLFPPTVSIEELDSLEIHYR